MMVIVMCVYEREREYALHGGGVEREREMKNAFFLLSKKREF